MMGLDATYHRLRSALRNAARSERSGKGAPVNALRRHLVTSRISSLLAAVAASGFVIISTAVE
jgi:hypothetical protein